MRHHPVRSHQVTNCASCLLCGCAAARSGATWSSRRTTTAWSRCVGDGCWVTGWRVTGWRVMDGAEGWGRGCLNRGVSRAPSPKLAARAAGAAQAPLSRGPHPARAASARGRATPAASRRRSGRRAARRGGSARGATTTTATTARWALVTAGAGARICMHNRALAFRVVCAFRVGARLRPLRLQPGGHQ